MATRIDGDMVVSGNLQIGGNLTPAVARLSMGQEDYAEYPVPLTEFRVFDAFQTALGAAGNDDLGITAGTFGTGSPYITAGDLKAAGATSRKARCLVQLPHEYVAGESVRLTLAAGMLTTVADTSCTVDVEAFKLDEDGTAGGSDLVTTGATTINSLTFGDKHFVLNGSGLSPGDILDVLVTVACNDGATGTAVIPAIAAVKLGCDSKG